MKKKIIIGIILIILISVISVSAVFIVNKQNKSEETKLSNTEEQQKNEETENKTEDENTTFDKSYLGYYSYENGNDILEFSLEERDGKIEFYMMYYPNNSDSPVEEIWGNWDTTSNNIEAVKNENNYPNGLYDFNNITYNGDEIKITIKINQIIEQEFKDYIIPEGTYTFEKQE